LAAVTVALAAIKDGNVTNVDAVELRNLKWAVVHVAGSKDARLLSMLRAISMTKDRIDDRDPVEIADDFIDDVDRILDPLGRFYTTTCTRIRSR
jgi:hypothetical protein